MIRGKIISIKKTNNITHKDKKAPVWVSIFFPLFLFHPIILFFTFRLLFPDIALPPERWVPPLMLMGFIVFLFLLFILINLIFGSNAIISRFSSFRLPLIKSTILYYSIISILVLGLIAILGYNGIIIDRLIGDPYRNLEINGHPINSDVIVNNSKTIISIPVYEYFLEGKVSTKPGAIGEFKRDSSSTYTGDIEFFATEDGAYWGNSIRASGSSPGMNDLKDRTGFLTVKILPKVNEENLPDSIIGTLNIECIYPEIIDGGFVNKNKSLTSGMFYKVVIPTVINGIDASELLDKYNEEYFVLNLSGILLSIITLLMTLFYLISGEIDGNINIKKCFYGNLNYTLNKTEKMQVLVGFPFSKPEVWRSIKYSGGNTINVEDYGMIGNGFGYNDINYFIIAYPNGLILRSFIGSMELPPGFKYTCNNRKTESLIVQHDNDDTDVGNTFLEVSFFSFFGCEIHLKNISIEPIKLNQFASFEKNDDVWIRKNIYSVKDYRFRDSSINNKWIEPEEEVQIDSTFGKSTVLWHFFCESKSGMRFTVNKIFSSDK